jgi:hypothetical protein
MTALQETTYGLRQVVSLTGSTRKRYTSAAGRLATTVPTCRNATSPSRSRLASSYVSRQREGRRNRYAIREDLPIRQPLGHERTVGELLALLIGEGRNEKRGSA